MGADCGLVGLRVESDYFRRNVRAIRMFRQQTQKEWAEQAGMPRSTLAKMEEGRQKIYLDHAVKLARITGFSIEELMGSLHLVAED